MQSVPASGAEPVDTGTDARLLRRYQAGDDDAATDLYLRYAPRLRALARQYCTPPFAGRFDADDVRQVRRLVERHQAYTGSRVAARLLADWPAAVKRFVKVLPEEYAKVLARAHLDTDEARVAAV